MAIMENIGVILLLVVLAIVVPLLVGKAMALQDLERDECDDL